MKRLPKGYGSVYKLSGNRRRPYAVRITVGEKKDGGPKYKYLGYFSTSEEALQTLAEYNKNPYNVEQSNATISDMWEIFKKRRFGVISESGEKVYTAAYAHLKPIQNKPIKELKTYQLQALIDGIDRKWQTKSHVQTLLHQLYDIACELDITTKNYAEFIKLGQKEKSEMHKMFTADEIKKLFDSVFCEPLADTALIMIYTGMRPSELLSVKIEDIHLNEKYMVGGVKTKAGKNRVIPINDKVLPFVLKRYNPDSLFLIEDNGHSMTYATYKRRFDVLMNHLDMNHLPHDGRHTFASLADTAGVNKMSVKLIMGHSSNDITEKVYTHKAISELLSAVNMI